MSDEIRHGLTEIADTLSRSYPDYNIKVTERRARVRATAHPATDDVVPFRDEIRGARETQIGERLAERHHECLHIRATSAWRVQ